MRRLLVVHFAPCAIFVTWGCAPVRAGSFSGRSDWAAAWPPSFGAACAAVLTAASCAAVLGMLLYPFQVRAVRVLEGYWDRWSATSRLGGLLVEVQRRRTEALRGSAYGKARGAVDRQVTADAARRLGARPAVDVLLPTALGNALRAGELSAGERYGLSTLASWPSIYMQVSDRMVDVLRSARDALDTAVNLCWCFLAITVMSAVALHEEPREWWLPGGTLLMAVVAYKGAVIAAQSYAGLMRLVYDLHRFDLVDALHYRLPSSQEEERELFVRVSDLLRGRGRPDVPYSHPRARESHADDVDRSTDGEHMDDQPS